jgi:hypothetical protein
MMDLGVFDKVNIKYDYMIEYHDYIVDIEKAILPNYHNTQAGNISDWEVRDFESDFTKVYATLIIWVKEGKQ